jgi:hypothetical protein
MPTTERESASLESDPPGLVPRLKPDAESLQAKFTVVMEGSAIAVQRLLQSLHNTGQRIIFDGRDTVEVALGHKELAGTASGPEETDSLTPDEMKQAMQESLEIIYSDGLDAPDSHLEYCRVQLRAAVA